MTNDQIILTPNAVGAEFGNELRNAVRAVQAANEAVEKVRDRMNHNGDGSAWGTIETRFGIPPGNGQRVYDAMNGMLIMMSTNADFIYTIDRLA